MISDCRASVTGSRGSPTRTKGPRPDRVFARKNVTARLGFYLMLPPASGTLRAMFYLKGEVNFMVTGNTRMRLTRLLGVLCVAFCAAALALPARAESAGKVLSADGDVLVLRGSQILRVFRGAAVESGDQIHTGSDGKVLIVFTDSGVVWIRGNSDFVVDEYSYAQGRREAAFFSLLKGGARSVTGLIGRRTRSNFRLRIPVATIGSRGVTPGATTSGLIGTLTEGLTGIVTSIAAPAVSTVTPVVTPIAAPAPSITLPGTISTTLPSALPISPILKR